MMEPIFVYYLQGPKIQMQLIRMMAAGRLHRTIRLKIVPFKRTNPDSRMSQSKRQQPVVRLLRAGLHLAPVARRQRLLRQRREKFLGTLSPSIFEGFCTPVKQCDS